MKALVARKVSRWCINGVHRDHHHIASACLQIKDAVRDGLRAVKNVLEDKSVVAGAGAWELAAAAHLRSHVKKQAQGRAKLGVEAFAEGLLGFVKILAENSG